MVNTDVLDEAHILILHTVCNKKSILDEDDSQTCANRCMCVFRAEISHGTAAAGAFCWMPVQTSDAVEGAVCCLDLLVDCLSTKVSRTQLCTHKCTWIHAPLPLSLHINVYIWVHYYANAYLVKHPVVSDLRWFSTRRLGVQHWYDPEYSNTTAWANIYIITHLMHKQDI